MSVLLDDNGHAKPLYIYNEVKSDNPEKLKEIFSDINSQFKGKKICAPKKINSKRSLILCKIDAGRMF